MASRRPRPRRLLLPTVLAAVLAAEITGLVLARTPALEIVPVAAPAAASGAGALPGQTRSFGEPPAPNRVPDVARADAAGASRLGPPAVGLTSPVHATRATASTRPATGGGSGHSSSKPSSPSYHGVNHVWIPSLGITKAVQSFPCSRTRPPDAGVYRWGCAGRNNVYLLGHAWSTFKPLHDAYVRGTLRKGMQVVYADGSGTVHTYSVIWWRVTAPTTAASWAWAALSTPSMTLQTCVGSNSQYRLMVRLVRIR